MIYSLFQLRSHTEFHVGMECGLFEYFCVGWGNAQSHYVITASAAANLPGEKDVVLSRRLQRVHWHRNGWRNTCKQGKLVGEAAYAKAK